ncbi:hypothetical protein M431DRAFT_8787 [Trichoderma harzianum CBS 226.95]|uniref:CCHC-type domain-containing protein n=1 Tax=Trichoderma harzianum CBS 226.95 TaxID=983964 RepID=A0A2T4A0Z1_TRIHA|nr:hypothetical protein M431DRAFT_8787 [Trichoderma harzianum CBS 226.95]PTB50729.1 hypothetical protein M431DRAFT_8787 [Trichoderma harzianum CBS 226.95]
MSDNNNNTRLLSLADWNALSTERKFDTIYHGFLSLTQENAGFRRENAELRRRVAELESQQQQQQQQQQQAAPAPAPTTITTIASASSSSRAVATTTTTAQKRCYNCDEPGHIKRHCPQNRAGRADPPAPFETPKYYVTVIDAPNHRDFINDVKIEPQAGIIDFDAVWNALNDYVEQHQQQHQHQQQWQATLPPVLVEPSPPPPPKSGVTIVMSQGTRKDNGIRGYDDNTMASCHTFRTA